MVRSRMMDTISMGEEMLSSTCFQRNCVDHVKDSDRLINTFLKKSLNLKDFKLTIPLKNLYPVTKLESNEDDRAAIKLQKTYKSYRTRRNLADCAVLVEELWWKALDPATFCPCSTYSSESVVSRWARVGTQAAKIGKGLLKDEKAQKLALRHWLEAIDPRHRYGHNLHMYYDVWFASESHQPFFYWLDVGDGKEVSLERCLRSKLQHQCVKYLGPKERQAYEVIVKNGKLVYKQSRMALNTEADTKWIFVLSATRKIYVGKKVKGLFQHSSFLAGGAAVSAGRLISHDGILQAVWPYSGHYRPTEETFMEFITFLEEQNVDLSNVKISPMDDDIPPNCINKEDLNKSDKKDQEISIAENKNNHSEENLPLKSKWTTGAGARIVCVREYPTKLQVQALEHVKLSPRTSMANSFCSGGPIPSPRPSPKIHLSPRISCMRVPSPRLLASANSLSNYNPK